MIKSEIFENYIRIATEKGLIKDAKESKELKDYKNDSAPRVGSDDISTIEALYGVKPDSSITYEKNIMEAAHPKSVIIAPSYDRLNGLVENNNERNNIMCNIVMKPTDGNNTNRKYAKDELMMQLVRIANDMDNRNNDSLRALADNCIDKLADKKKVKKLAVAPLVIWGAVIAATLAATWLFYHVDDPNKGLLGNCDNAIKQLNDLKTNSWYESDVDEIVQRDTIKLIAQIELLKKAVVDFNSIKDKIYEPRTLTELNTELKTNAEQIISHAKENGDVVKQKLESFVDVVKEITPVLDVAIENFKSKTYQLAHTNQSWLGDAAGWLGEALHGRWGLVGNDFISVVNALDPLKESLLETVKSVDKLGEVKSHFEEQANKSQKEVQTARENSEESDEGSDDEASTLKNIKLF